MPLVTFRRITVAWLRAPAQASFMHRQTNRRAQVPFPTHTTISPFPSFWSCLYKCIYNAGACETLLGFIKLKLRSNFLLIHQIIMRFRLFLNKCEYLPPHPPLKRN